MRHDAAEQLGNIILNAIEKGEMHVVMVTTDEGVVIRLEGWLTDLNSDDFDVMERLV